MVGEKRSGRGMLWVESRVWGTSSDDVARVEIDMGVSMGMD